MTVDRWPFHIVAKPIGPLCNMNCSYCFYSEKQSFYPDKKPMTDEMLERFTRTYISAHPGPEVSFLWQGGEPLLLDIAFYQKAINFQWKYCGNKRITNSIQTNGTLLTDEWCRFLKRNHFLVGLSLDGPPEIHNAYRRMRSGKPSHPLILRGLRLLQKHQVDFNVTCCISDVSACSPLTVYRYFKALGVEYLQFAPLVEREPETADRNTGLKHACPDTPSKSFAMMKGSVGSLDYGKFLSIVFDEWVHKDIGQVYVMNFEWALGAWLGLPASYCIFAPSCGEALAVEHNGDIYSCDHYVYSSYHLGNLNRDRLSDLLFSPTQQAFRQKKSTLPERCLGCSYRFACHGECPKNRFMPNGENYLCEGYRYYFAHIDPYMRQLAQLIRAGKDPQLLRNELQKNRRDKPICLTKNQM